ncbi:hypothetical protein [Paenibacillus sp. GYB003]|uniref:hypothetical protein n=1 Tax=Paenibacillus sp. GYB003 TaxID=2994392 RepID=UPI002F96792B
MERLPSETNRIFEPFSERVPEAVLRALTVMGGALAGCERTWLVGGSCGLLLQGVPLEAAPRDLDVYADAEHAPSIHAALAGYSIDGQTYSETGMYGSLLSHYSVEGVQVELVGSLKVTLPNADYEVRVESLLGGYAMSGRIGEAAIRFMPLAHELVFNVLRERPDRYEPIAASIRRRLADHLPLLADMLRSNRIGEPHTGRLKSLLALPPGFGRGDD